MTTRPRDARHAPLAASLSGLSPAEATARLIERDIVLDWTPAVERSRAGRALVLTTANLVVRFCPSLRLRPTSSLAASVSELMRAIDGSADPDRRPPADALRIHLGGGAPADVTATAAGWIAGVSGYGEVLPELDDRDPAVGAHAAAAFAASQTFARVLPLDPRRAGPSRATTFSTYDYCADGTNPMLGLLPVLDRALLAGSGAVGQACVDTFVSTGATGHLVVVDNGYVDDPTNLNRSALALEKDLADSIAKVRLAWRRAQGSGLVIDPVEAPLSDVIAEIEAGERELPRMALSALDNRPARWDLQSLWPDLVVEGATGDSMVQIFRHAHGEATACLRCLHPDHTHADGPSYLVRMAALTGLTAERLKHGLDNADDEITDADLSRASLGVRELAGDHLGRDICGFLSDIERLLGPNVAAPQLSVAFSSYLAGVFLAAEVVKASSGVVSPLPGRYQIDPLATLRPDPPFLQRPSTECFCQHRANTVEAIRAAHHRVESGSLYRHVKS